MDNGDNGIVFSAEELNLMQDENLLRTKQAIIKKMHQLLADTEYHLRQTVSAKIKSLPEYILTQTGKISRGENYHDLPYLVLDFPRHFTQEAIFAYRTMFWWGNFLSCTLHLQGKALEKFRTNLLTNLPTLKEDIFFCIAPTPWEYHYGSDNYVVMNEIPVQKLEQLIATKDFIKISRKLPLESYDQLAGFSTDTFDLFWKAITETNRF